MIPSLRVESIFLSALEQPSLAERDRYLDEACDGDSTLRLRVQKLLDAHPRALDFLAEPVFVSLDTASPSTPIPSDDLDTAADAGTHFEAFSLGFLQPADRPGILGLLAHYEVLEVLGTGGFSVVVKALDKKLHRLVAIKLLSPLLALSSTSRRRFLREASSAAAVRHENVVIVHAVEELPLPYLVMEYVAGPTLEQRLRTVGPLDLADILRIGRQVAAGLAAAHARGLVHRDVKPGNVMLEVGTDRAKLTDFGLARAADDHSVTQVGLIAGTPAFMSPEQAQGAAVDERSDLFSLAGVLYAMCTGEPPFGGTGTLSILRHVSEDSPRPIEEINPAIPARIVDLIAGLHVKDPAQRLTTAEDVVRILDLELAKLSPFDTETAASPSPDEPNSLDLEPERTRDAVSFAPRPKRRARRLVVVAALVGLTLCGLGFAESSGVTDVRGTVIRLFSPDGTLVIEIDDPEIHVQIDGADITITGAGLKEIRLRPGVHQVRATSGGKLVRQQLVEVTKNGRRLVRISRDPIEAEPWERTIAGLPERERKQAVLARLRELNPGEFIHLTADNPFLDLKVESRTLRDISPVRAFPGLQKLDISANSLTDLSPLRGLPLTLLTLHFTGVTDLSPLQGMPLQLLDLTASYRLESIAPLIDLPLKSLNLAYTKVSDIRPVAQMKLDLLNIVGTLVTDLSPLQGSSITRLWISSTKVADLRPLAGMAIVKLNIDSTPIADFTPLAHLPLRDLVCDPPTPSNAAILRKITTLEIINDKPVAQFWKEYDAQATK